jgi:glycosyltransferase involved in cell wall biosynthesis
MHFLHFNAPLFYRRPSVVTIHDLTRFLFPAQKHRGLFHQWAYEEVFRSTILHARRIIAVSEHTRNDLARFFPDAAERTVVIPEGVEHDQYRPAPHPSSGDEMLMRLGVTKPYLLFVGVWMNHKNLSRLLEAFREVRRQGFPGRLVITGSGRAHDEDVPRMVQRLGLSQVVLFPGNVPEDLLPSLYRQAFVFVFPSLYEGFGLPPLEAMACGVAVVASRVASLPEVLGAAAEYVDPLSSEDIARGILRVLRDRSHRDLLIQRGRARAQMYHWERCARETLEVYASVVQRKRDAVRVTERF